MKLVLALALSLPALAGAMGMATREPMDSQTNEAPNGPVSYTHLTLPTKA